MSSAIHWSVRRSGNWPARRPKPDAVYDLLRGRFEVDQPAEKPSALEVLAGLYKKPYRIVHLAGHGHYEPPTTADGKARSGMVLDNGVFLTAVEVGQMQQVPELVFLNCCHIGQTGPEAMPRTPTVEFNRLAASVSRELIEMGVRAVVAAGWAVTDDAAKGFACKFYECMLGGESFGRALKAARTYTHDNFPDSNTWGAYQAYGDPDYRLDPTGSGTRSTGLDQVDVAEFIEAVNDIGRTAEAGTGTGRSLSTSGEDARCAGERLPRRLARRNRRADGDRLRLRQAQAVRSRRRLPRDRACRRGRHVHDNHACGRKARQLRVAPCRRDCRRPG